MEYGTRIYLVPPREVVIERLTEFDRSRALMESLYPRIAAFADEYLTSGAIVARIIAAMLVSSECEGVATVHLFSRMEDLVHILFRNDEKARAAVLASWNEVYHVSSQGAQGG